MSALSVVIPSLAPPDRSGAAASAEPTQAAQALDGGSGQQQALATSSMGAEKMFPPDEQERVIGASDRGAVTEPWHRLSRL